MLPGQIAARAKVRVARPGVGPADVLEAYD
jgi:hypothetical protein